MSEPTYFPQVGAYPEKPLQWPAGIPSLAAPTPVELAAEILKLRAENARLRGECNDLRARLGEFLHGGAVASANVYQQRLPLGEASVLVEFEYSPASGDGFHEEHFPEGLEVHRVLINGIWCVPGDVTTPEVMDRWVEDEWDRRKSEADALADEAAVQRFEDRQLFAEVA